VDVNSRQAFDTATGTWSTIAKLPIKGSHFEPSSIVHNGRILIVGGRSNSSLPPSGAVNNVTEYGPKTDSWRLIPRANEKACHPRCFDYHF